MSHTGVIVVTHGDAAVSMVQAVERVVGSLDVKTVTVQVGEPRVETEKRLSLAVAQLETREVLFLVDLEGSTPFNLCCNKIGVVLTGMNLPMLFKLATVDRHKGAAELAEELRATGLKSIHVIPGGHS
jgi:mannose/fructose-specific phosphotransferase system component IIA